MGMIELRTGEGSGVTVQPFLRTTAGTDAVGDTLRRLRQLDVEGAVDVWPVRRWPATVRLASDGHGPNAVDVYERFAAWAERTDRSLEPAFEIRARHSELTGESHADLTMPVIALAVYADEGIVAVFPHADGDEVHTVADAVDELATGRSRPSDRERSTDAAVVTCPDCGTRIVNVQGIQACLDCRWTEGTGSDGRRPAAGGR